MTDRIYAIGDIHGQISMLHHALELISKDGHQSEEIIFVGDYVDRGPDSRAVIDLLLQGQAEGHHWTTLKGNHDRMFRRFGHNGTVHDKRITTPGLDWLHPRLGGVETLASYGVRAAGKTIDELVSDIQEAVPPAHFAFIDALPLTAQRGPLLFVHGGLRPDVALEDQVEDDLIWIRDPFLNHPNPFPWLVVHGHTAVDSPKHFGTRIDLDGGAGYGRPLVPAVFEGTEAWLLTQTGRQPLTP